MMGIDENELAWRLRHEGIRAGEIVAYRAWLVKVPRWFRDGDDRLHSVYMRDYVWRPDEPASGDVRTHGIYSFRDAVLSRDQYRHCSEPLLFGMVKIWGEVVEHEWGYRSQFGKIVSLDYGDPELLEKFRKMYRVNQVSRAGNSSKEEQPWAFETSYYIQVRCVTVTIQSSACSIECAKAVLNPPRSS